MAEVTYADACYHGDIYNLSGYNNLDISVNLRVAGNVPRLLYPESDGDGEEEEEGEGEGDSYWEGADQVYSVAENAVENADVMDIVEVGEEGDIG